MPLSSIANPKRGCGRLKAGGCYARGDFSSGGTLNAWTWTLGEHIIGRQNLMMNVAPRQMQLINLPGTLATGRLTTESLGVEQLPPEHAIQRLPQYALIDHVGSAHYTAWEFAQETIRHGPSRRLPRGIAKVLAKHTPIPIVFCHSWLPLADEMHVDGLLAWAATKREDKYFGPTFDHPDWGLGQGDWKGGGHWVTDVVSRMHFAGKGKPCHLTKIMAPELVENTLLEEMIFGISWITRLVYVAREEDDEKTRNDIWNDGLEPVCLS